MSITIKLRRPDSTLRTASHVAFASDADADHPTATAAESHPSPQQHHHQPRIRLVSASSSAPLQQPPFRPASAHPLDASFYTSTYEYSSTAGVSSRKRKESKERCQEKQDSRVRNRSRERPQSASSNTSASANSSSSGGGPIPVRHTRRSSEHASRFANAIASEVVAAAQSASSMNIGSAGSTASPIAVAAAASKSLPSSTSLWTHDLVTSHYEPLLHLRTKKLSDFHTRLRKHEIRLAAMHSWKVRALEQVVLEVSPLDMVLTERGVEESKSVRRKRLLFQRTMIRQFVHTYKLRHNLLSFSRSIRVAIPLLLDSPHSCISDDTKDEMFELTEKWREERRREEEALERKKRGMAQLSEETAQATRNRSMSRRQSTRAPDAGSANLFALATATPAIIPLQDDVFYRSHPHSHTHALLRELFHTLPLLHTGIREQLSEKLRRDQENYDVFLENNTKYQQVKKKMEESEKRRERIEILKQQIEEIDNVTSTTRTKYSETLHRLHSLQQREHHTLRKLNHMYYSDIETRYGREYVIRMCLEQMRKGKWEEEEPFLQVVGRPPGSDAVKSGENLFAMLHPLQPPPQQNHANGSQTERNGNLNVNPFFTVTPAVIVSPSNSQVPYQQRHQFEQQQQQQQIYDNEMNIPSELGCADDEDDKEHNGVNSDSKSSHSRHHDEQEEKEFTQPLQPQFKSTAQPHPSASFSSSPVPGMSPEVYSLSHQLALSHLHSLGYSSHLSLFQLAHSLVSRGVIQASAPKRVQTGEPGNVVKGRKEREESTNGGGWNMNAAVINQQSRPTIMRARTMDVPSSSSQRFQLNGGYHHDTSTPSLNGTITSGWSSIIPFTAPYMTASRFDSTSPTTYSSTTRSQPRVVKQRPMTSIHRVRPASAIIASRPPPSGAALARIDALTSGMPITIATYNPTPPNQTPRPASANMKVRT